MYINHLPDNQYQIRISISYRQQLITTLSPTSLKRKMKTKNMMPGYEIKANFLSKGKPEYATLSVSVRTFVTFSYVCESKV
jgi:hypothetical protein